MLSNDYDLKKTDIQELSSADAVAALFTALGYDTDQRILQTSAVMGFPESLARELVRIECIADQEQKALQVYLVELKHVNVALTQALARTFKNRSGLFLFVLTMPDYERLDFVLMEPIAPEARSTGGISGPQTVLRPRILSVERRNPDPVSLRVLRRFSYTEIDADYQWDKLRSAYSIAEWSEPLFNNRALFSDYYLKERLPNRAEWKADPRTTYRSLSGLLVEVRHKYASQPEEKLRLELLEPALRMLGWSIEAGKGPKDASTNKPDYWLKTLAGKKVPCLAYGWDRALDGPDDKRDADTPRENPAQSVVSILDCLGEDCAGWAVMTNGKTWRLYSAHAHSRATNYYEIDLEETLASPDLADAFRYFWLLFRAESFNDVPSFVDSLLTESESYAKALGERLKERVFEQVFPHFAEGFIHHMRQTSEVLETSEVLDETYHATLTFLYRLLFLLYAEARDLLPVRETRGYWEISLDRMKKEIAEKAGTIDDQAPDRLKKAYSAASTELYERLNHLFQGIDKGEATLNVPVYNGGLFVTLDGDSLPEADETEAEELRAARFLSTHKIPDRSLAQGLDLLSRDIDEKSLALAMIDYKSLGVRQLGSIYEGLLEFKLRVAREKMAVIAGKKGDEIVPYAEAQKQDLKIRQTGRGADRAELIIHKGAVYLENDKHERKASGSYYTPDYIVKYIVQNTVGPALQAKSESLRPKMREAEKAYQAAVRRMQAFQKMGQKGDDPEKTAYTFRAVVDELFDLRVLDPAMGSGHFLVEAVDFLTDRLLAFLNAFPWNPVTAALRQTRQTILEEMQKQGVNVDPARLTDVNLLKRHVLKRCIYGVDLNPMAVELAKVSLWLDCFTLGAPLSFLDHHLKCGNSLIGARIEEVRAAIEMAAEQERLEIPLLVGIMGGSQFAGVMMSVDLMRRVGELSDVTAAQVKESRAEFRKAADALAPYKRILDVYTSRWFGNADTRLDQPVVSFLRDERNLPWIQNPVGHLPPKPASRSIAETALNAAHEKRFFHWELEFPEVFFGPSQASQQQIVMKENPGFNAVIGNPPYIRAENADKEQRIYLLDSTSYKHLYGRFDIYTAFLENGISVLKQDGMYGVIIPRAFLTINYCEPIRKWILSKMRLDRIVDFGDEQVFNGVGITCCIPIIQKLIPIESSVTSIEIGERSVISIRWDTKQNVLLNLPSSSIRTSDLDKQQSAKNQIEKVSLPLGTWCYAITGIVAHDPRTGASKDRLITISPDFSESVRYIEAKEWEGRYSAVLGNRYIRYLPDEMHRPKFRELFESPKLLIPGISSGGFVPASLDNTGVWCNHSLNCCVKLESVIHLGSKLHIDWQTQIEERISLSYVLACITSRLVGWYHFSFLSDSLGISPDTVRLLPLRRITFSTSTERHNTLAKEAQALIAAGNGPAVLEFVASRLSARPEESDVVHDLPTSLAQRMIDLNKQKQAEMKRFLGWLERALTPGPSPKKGEGSLLDNLTGRSKLKNYLGDYQKSEPELSFGELEDILYKNKGKLGLSLGDARLMAKLCEEYEQSLAVLRPLKSSLAWTDGVIDQVVYKLYGLTEEEIKVVEGIG